jgi:predicted transcriptional regulator
MSLTDRMEKSAKLNEPLLSESGQLHESMHSQSGGPSRGDFLESPSTKSRSKSDLRPTSRDEYNSPTDIDNKRYLFTPGAVSRKIDRETIMPPEELERKKEIILVEENTSSKSCWTSICPFWKNRKMNLFSKISKKKGPDSLLNILEVLYLSYNQELVNMLWHKPVDEQTKNKLRDDFSYWMNFFVNYWVSFNDSSDDTIAEITNTISSSVIFYGHRMISFLLANYFQEYGFETIDAKIDERIQRIVSVSCNTFTLDKFIIGLSRLDLVDPVKKVKKIFKIYRPVIATLPLAPPMGSYFESDTSPDMSGERLYLKNMYLSQLAFLQDIMAIPRVVDHSKTKAQKFEEIKELLNEINKQLPSFVYIPSENNTYRRMIIVRIEPSETRLFPTKTKTNFSCCFQLISPEEYIMRNYYSYKDKREKYISQHLNKIQETDAKTVDTPATLLMQLNAVYQDKQQPKGKHAFQRGAASLTHGKMRNDAQAKHLFTSMRFDNPPEDESMESNDISLISDYRRTRRISCGAVIRRESTGSKADQENAHIPDPESKEVDPTLKSTKGLNSSIFGVDSNVQLQRVKLNSLYSAYFSWRIKNYIVKVGDDARQEYFAMQLIKEFDSIFRLKKLKLLLTPYEIIPIGANSCLLEMVQDATSIHSLKESLFQTHNRSISLFEFFGLYFGKGINNARKNFCYSLAAYSLVCYFLQIKDRHNGNILLHKDGRIVHIDFGFLFTTAPGKGVELEKHVPFKLLSEYVALLGDKARVFVLQFRKGFDAIIEQRERILSMMRMMILTQMKPFDCLADPERAFVELEKRLSPPSEPKARRKFVDGLIDMSWDNWRARWYDKFQFCCEGIHN